MDYHVINYNENMEEKAMNIIWRSHHHEYYKRELSVQSAWSSIILMRQFPSWISTVRKNNNNIFVFFIISYMNSNMNIIISQIYFPNNKINSASLKHGVVLGEGIVKELYLKL